MTRTRYVYAWTQIAQDMSNPVNCYIHEQRQMQKLDSITSMSCLCMNLLGGGFVQNILVSIPYWFCLFDAGHFVACKLDSLALLRIFISLEETRLKLEGNGV